MLNIVPFSKYRKQGLTIEQLLLKDYTFFCWMEKRLQASHWIDKFATLHHKANNYLPQVKCTQCGDIPRIMSVYRGYQNYRGSDANFIYCSETCLNCDSLITNEKNKVEIVPLQISSTLSSTKSDTKNLVELICYTMGMKKQPRTKEYLEYFFNNLVLKTI